VSAALEARVVVDHPGGFRLDVELCAAPGELVAVMGPSGAGKSTLLHAVAGLVRLDGGSVRVGGVTVADAAARSHVRPADRGVVLLGQQPRLFPHLTARDNVAFGLRAHGATRRQARHGAEEWLARIGLADLGGRRPAALSGGQQQRVAVARALATSPRVLLFDEPLSDLDPQTEADVRAVISEQLAATGTTAVVVTHDALDAAALAGRLVVLEAGLVTQQGTTVEVLRSPATAFTAVAAGLNRVPGQVTSGRWRSSAGGVRLATGDDAAPRRAALVFRPSDVRLSTVQPPASDGSACWSAEVVRLERQPVGVRVHTAQPEVSVDVGADLVADLGLRPGVPVWLQLSPGDARVVAGQAEASGTGGPSQVPPA
jgi:molybdate transport system ATP-binding protein